MFGRRLRIDVYITSPYFDQSKLGAWISCSYKCISINNKNHTKKFDQSVMYASRSLNLPEQNYIIIEKEALVMVYALHKFKHYLLGNRFVFYVDHMALMYLVNKPQVSGIIIRWLPLFLESDFNIVYQLILVDPILWQIDALPSHGVKPTWGFHKVKLRKVETWRHAPGFQL
jgi:hypothetical protein